MKNENRFIGVYFYLMLKISLSFILFLVWCSLVQLGAVHQTPKISLSQLSLVSSKKAKYLTNAEDFCISVEFGAVGAVGAVKF